MPIPTRTPTRVHIAGPVEIEGRAGRRVEVQRCLRCDSELWSPSRTVGPHFPVGELVAWIEREGSLIATDLARPRMLPGEIRCDAP